MEYKTFPGGIKIPVIGIGTWEMGENISEDVKNIKALKEAIRLGMTHIDTAESYAAGHAEELVGKAIKSFNRKRLFITTKVKPEHLRFDQVLKAAKASLKRLDTDYIDLYLIHWPNPDIFLEETMRAFDFLVDEDLVKYIGVSNFSVKLLEEAQSYSKNKIIANQVEYNLLSREPEKELLSFCQKKKIMLTAYQPLARGKLAKPGFVLLDELAKKYGKTQAQIALNWLISKSNVVIIPKSSNIEHLRENLGAIGWKMEKKDIERLDTYGFKRKN